MQREEVDAPRLTLELLARLEGRWRDIGAPIAQHLRPGLSAERIDEIVAPLGLTVPAEARVWWGWHDGASASTRPDGEPFPGWWFPSLGAAVSQAEWERREAVALAGEDAEKLLWRASWLPVATDIGGNHAALDCAAPPDEPSPVYYADREGGAEKFEPRAASLGLMIQWWIDAIDSGAAHFDGGRWHRDFARFDADRARSGLL